MIFSAILILNLISANGRLDANAISPQPEIVIAALKDTTQTYNRDGEWNDLQRQALLAKVTERFPNLLENPKILEVVFLSYLAR